MKVECETPKKDSAVFDLFQNEEIIIKHHNTLCKSV